MKKKLNVYFAIDGVVSVDYVCIQCAICDILPIYNMVSCEADTATRSSCAVFRYAAHFCFSTLSSMFAILLLFFFI